MGKLLLVAILILVAVVSFLVGYALQQSSNGETSLLFVGNVHVKVPGQINN